MADKPSEIPSDALTVLWSDAVRFIRQLSHDLRNDLNAIELQSAYIGELTQDEALQNEIKRLRKVVSDMNSILQRLSRAVAEVTPNPIPYRAAEFFADMRTEIDGNFSRQTEIQWDAQLQDGMLNVDPQLLREAFLELFDNAVRHERGTGRLLAKAEIANDGFFFILQEPKARSEMATNDWAREPLRNISQRHYGLGLNRVRAIVEAHGGELHARYDPKTSALTTILRLPVASESSKDV
jgi:signal transduction histidine kinase